MYVKQHGLKISERKAELTKHDEFSATHVEMLSEMFWKVKNVITRVNTTSEAESSDSDGQKTYVEESFAVLFVTEEDIQHVN